MPNLAVRLARQHLTGARFADPVAAVAWFGAVQSQEFAGSAWGIGQRCAGLDEAGFRRVFDAGGVVRTHVLRPTWHLVTPADLRWMQALTAPRVHAANAPYYRRSELDPATLARCADVISGALAGGQELTRKELGAALAAGGIEPGDPLRLGLITMWCELEALICSGAMRGRQHTYALVDERLPEASPRERDEALGALARRYFASQVRPNLPTSPGGRGSPRPRPGGHWRSPARSTSQDLPPSSGPHRSCTCSRTSTRRRRLPGPVLVVPYRVHGTGPGRNGRAQLRRGPVSRPGCRRLEAFSRRWTCGGDRQPAPGAPAAVRRGGHTDDRLVQVGAAGRAVNAASP